MHDVVRLQRLKIQIIIATHSGALIDFSLRLQQWNTAQVSENLPPHGYLTHNRSEAFTCYCNNEYAWEILNLPDTSNQPGLTFV